MEAIARVLAVGDGRARLACQVHSSCKSCAAGRGCGLRFLTGRRDAVIEVLDRTDSQVPLVEGQLVTIAVRDQDVLGAASLVYLPVLAGLLAGALLGRGLAGPGDGPVAAAGAVGAACTWAIARARARHRQPRVSVMPATEDTLA